MNTLEFDKHKETLDTLLIEGVLTLRNGSAEVFFDDVGIVQKIVIKRQKRKEPGRDLQILHNKNTSVSLEYDGDAVLQKIEYETKWRRPKLTPTPKASQ